jgi:hypothetical protein
MRFEEFPDEYDVREVVGYYTMPYKGVKHFFQGHGILFAARGKKHIAAFVQNLILEYQDYRDLQVLALSGGSGNSISGFTLSSEDWMIENTSDLFDDIKEERRIQISQSSNGDDPSRTQFKDLSRSSDHIYGKLHYQRISPGKVILLNKADEEVEFQIEPLTDRVWRVICFPDSNRDVQELESTLSNMANSEYTTETPILDPLRVSQRIAFFDALLLRDFEDWNFEQVVGITVRQPEDDEPIPVPHEEFDEEGEFLERSPDSSDLSGISQAIIEGRRLRTNSFVKKCEGQGFYFSSMTIQYRHKDKPEIMNINVRFKLNPQMFEIALEDTFRVEELEQLEPYVFKWQRQQEVLQLFWGICNDILDQLNEKPAEAHQPFLPKGKLPDQTKVNQ